MPIDQIKLQVLLCEEEGLWSAQCLHYDIGAEADSYRDVLYEFERAVVGYLVACEHYELEPFTNLGPAPQAYWDKWNAADRIQPKELPHFRKVSGPVLPRVRSEIRMAA